MITTLSNILHADKEEELLFYMYVSFINTDPVGFTLCSFL